MNNDDWYFVESARKNTGDAITFDSRGRASEAIECYERACHALAMMARMRREDYRLVKAWMGRYNAYQNRIKALKQTRRNRKFAITAVAIAAAFSASSHKGL